MSKHPHSSGFRRRRATARALLAVGAVSMMALLLVPYTPADAYGNPLLERRQISHRDLGAFDQWTGILARYEWQHTAARAGCSDNSTCSSAQWEGLLSALKDAPFAVKLEEVNRFFNTVAYVSDEENYGSDYWQTPYEFMARGGDCEDYVIAKYLSLKRLGVPARAMRVLVVTTDTQEPHAVLEVLAGDMPYILDNKVDEVLPESQVHHYAPLYAINESRWWAYK